MSLRKAINAKCKECIYDPIGGPGTWRQQVEVCKSYSCPIFNVRPGPTKTTRKDVNTLEISEKGQNGPILDHSEG